MNPNAKVFRKGDSETAQRLWDVIRDLHPKRKLPSVDTIARHCYKNFGMDRDKVEQEINYLSEDQLLLKQTAIPTKGSNKGIELVVYRVPEEPEVKVKSSHDWYCFNCHKPGEVVSCVSCFRVYHSACLENNQNDLSENSFCCLICKELKSIREPSQDERRELNLLLNYTCIILETKFPNDIYLWTPTATAPAFTPFTTDRCAAISSKKQKLGGPSTAGKKEVTTFRKQLLIFKPIDLSTMTSRSDRQVYKSQAQFRADVLTLVHNVAVFHGVNSPIADSARIMYRDCLKHLEEMEVCRGCYKRAHEQEEKNWFCIPCNPPHELVYARQKGFPFWPAKVWKIEGDLYDVVFFGVGHERATIDKSQIRPVTANVSSLVPKRNSSWKKAYNELQEHLSLLESSKISVEEEDSSDDENLIDESIKKLCRTARINLTKCDLESSLKASQVSDEDWVTSSSEHHLQNTSNNTIQRTTESRDQLLKPKYEAALKQIAALQSQIDELKSSHSREMAEICARHAEELAQTKKKEWCYTCGALGALHCCRNNFYCSTECQMVHWKAIHKNNCRRKNELKN